MQFLRDQKIWVQLLLTIALALVVVWTGAIVWQDQGNRKAAIEQASGFSLSMHDATMAGLTGMMVTGTIAQRAVFLDQVKALNNIRDVRIVRAESLNKMFGTGNAADTAAADALEAQVLASGKEVVQVERDEKGEYLRAVRPTLALKNYLGKDCTVCHQAAEGAVLGVLSMKLSLEGSNAAIARQRASSILVALITCVPVLLVIYPFIRQEVTRPLERSADAARAIAKGDLAHEIVAGSRNEIGQLQRSLKDMRDSLVLLVDRVRQGTVAVGAAAGKITSGNADLSSRTEAQAEALREATRALAGLTDAAQRNAESAGQANQLAISASQVATQGGAVVADVVQTMDAISASSSRIADIVGTIDGIAFQTNILALNAAVEASRAGEHGRGFAVVAAEVRTLAQRSAAAASEIKALIGGTVGQVGDATQRVHEAGSTMTEIVQSVGRVTDIMGRINGASLEQIAGVRELNDAMVRVDDVTQRNAALVDEATVATQSLQQQAVHLEEVVGVFHLAGSAQAAADTR